MASKAEKAPPLPPTPDELWRRDGGSLRVDGDEYAAWAAGYGKRVEVAELEAEHLKLKAVESDARAKRLRLEQRHPRLVPGAPQRSMTGFQLVSIGLQVFCVVVVLALAARMLKPGSPTPLVKTPENASPAFETALPQ